LIISRLQHLSGIIFSVNIYMNSDKCDIAIIGAGIVGLGTALALSERFPRYSLAIIEKEPEVACHQTGHNSGVIHAGIYYKPGSYKARLCTQGVRLLTEFCEANSVRFERCGKLVIATAQDELPRLQMLYERGTANGIEGLQMIGPDRAREIEPHARVVQALYSPNTAIVDYSEVAAAMAQKIADQGHRIIKAAPVRAINQSGSMVRVTSGKVDFEARHLINCAGLYADRIARLAGVSPDLQIIPFRGEYYSLQQGQDLIRALIYPVPDPEFPFLGVHFTRRIRGEYEAGPNAVLAFAREGYRFADVNLTELLEMAAYKGFWTMAWRYWRMEIFELYRSLSRAAFLRALQKLVPELEDKHLAPGGSGVRAQAVTRQGSLVDDFKIVEAPNAIHVLNAPSPAATASLAIGRHIAELAAKSFDLK
jgi:(S)-2-hydroxyglutarate dehydrogenase